MNPAEFEKLKLLYDQVESLTKSGAWELDLQNNELSWSEGVFKMLGFEPNEFEVTFEKGLSVIHPKDRQRATALMEEVVRNKTEYKIEKRLIKKSGETIHVRSKAKLFYDNDGKPRKLIGVFQDISDFVNAQKQVEEQNSLTNDIIRNLPAIFFLFNRDGKIHVWNKQLKKVTEFSDAEIASKKVEDFFQGEERTKVKHQIGEVFRTGHAEIETSITNNKGRNIPLYFTASLIQYKGEECVFGTGTDITERVSLLHELQLLVDNTEEAYTYLDREWKVVSFNKQMSTHSNFLLQSAIEKGKSLLDAVKLDQREDLKMCLKLVSNGEEVNKIVQDQGSEAKQFYELKLKPIFSEKDEVVGIFLTSLNVTEALKARKELEASQEKLQQVLDSSLDTLCTIDENGIFQMVSSSSEQLWGYKPEELEGQPFLQFIIEEDRDLTLAVAEEIQKGKTFRNFRNRYRHKEGYIVPVVWSGYWESSQNLMNCIARDASDQLKDEEELYMSERRFKALVQEGGDLIAILNLDGIYKYVSPTSTTILDRDPGEFLGKSAFDFIHPNDLEWVRDEFTKLERERNINLPAFRFLNGRGEWRWVESSLSNLLDEPHVKGIVANSRDVTEKIELQQTVDNAIKLARVGGWEINMKTNEHFWSPTTKEIHEVPDDFTPDLDTAINFYHSDYREKVTEAVEKAISSGDSFDFEALIITFKGHERWVRAKGNAEFLEGQCVRLYGSFQDIHDQKIVELRLEKISNNVPGVIFQYHLKSDGTDLLDFVSKRSEEIFGFTPEECMQTTEVIWSRIEAGGDMPQMKESILKSADQLTPWHFVWRYHHPNGMIRYHEGSGNPQKLSNGTVIWDSIITDITDFKELEILAERTAGLAKIGSWELNWRNGKEEVYWSPMTKEILEVDAEYNPSLSDGLSFYSDHSRNLIEEAINELIDTAKEFDLELLIKTQNGNEKWVRCIGQADRIGGKTNRIFGSYQDIDKQKKSRIALQEALKDRKDILESIGDAFFAVDNDWTVTYWNREAENVLGKKRHEILNKNLWTEYGDAINLKFYTEYHKAVELQQKVHFEEYFPPLKKWFEVSAYPSKKGLSVYFKDVTLRKSADEEIKQSNERFEKVALATSDAIWDWDLLTGESLRFGTGFEKRFGYSNEEANKSPTFWKQKVHPDDLTQVLKSQKEALHNKSVNFWKEEYRFKKKSGEYAYVIDKGYIVRSDSGRAIRMIGATTDISDRKAYETSLVEINEKLEKQTHALSVSNAELEQFAYVASHDLQEPLRMVSGFLTQLEKKYGNQLDDKANQYIHFAVDGAKRMRQIILDLLDFSRIGKEEAEQTEVNLNDVVQEVCLLHRKQIEELNAEVLFDNLPKITGHPSPMIQLFQNLISNALKYRDSKIPPKVLIKARKLKKDWKFSVADNGIGIEKKYFDRIFNIFQRLHNKTEYSGTGMGLAIVKKIIESQNGKIWVDSEKGKGTTFYFTIPINQSREI
ncbi:PAS domain-containing protein [Marivirga harenae]|uniref:PAS domain-containing protein n=1 Tax=Marivirga harenae TaxID=2010992 RepID=UPI0026E0FA41|nr:PAS domain-containing protein [Marivirga harenae]WKV13385.1 PAS domain-containing protein [Marivirga harenae]